jgi:hypothetical protein
MRPENQPSESKGKEWKATERFEFVTGASQFFRGFIRLLFGM